MVAGQTGSIGVVVGLAEGRDCSADSVVVKPEFTASEAGSLVPVPLGTANIGDFFSRSQLTKTVIGVGVVSLVASKASSIGIIISLAEVVDGSTDAISIEVPEVRAG